MSSILFIVAFIVIVFGAIVIGCAVIITRALQRTVSETADRVLSIPERILAALVGTSTSSQAASSARFGHSYRYQRKQYLLTRSENRCFQVLTAAVGDRYLVFAQVRLSGLLYEKIRGQSWRGALGKINQKSVDFVLCDKENVSPKLAIELDDPTHERLDRRRRDEVVDGILADAGLPLLRLRAADLDDVSLLRGKVAGLILA